MVAIPYMLASIVLGFLGGAAMPADVKKVLHPLITCFLVADLCAMLFGVASGVGFVAVLKGFLTK
eukprot:213680-Pyramimonas_sp.AAC.1